MMNSNLYQGIALVALFAMSAAGYVRSAEGADLDAEVDSGVSGEIRFVSMQSRNKRIQDNLFSEGLYLEKTLADGLSAFGAAYHDKEFESAYLGIAKQFGDVQVAIGAGMARYDDISRLVVNPWLYYHSNEYTGLLTAEHYSKEPDDPWYYKGYIERKFNDSYLAGLYGEKGMGAGPMVGMYLGSQTKIWASAPIISRPNQGGMRAIFGFTFEF